MTGEAGPATFTDRHHCDVFRLEIVAVNEDRPDGQVAVTVRTVDVAHARHQAHQHPAVSCRSLR